MQHDLTLGTKFYYHVICLWISVIDCLLGSPHLDTLFWDSNEELSDGEDYEEEMEDEKPKKKFKKLSKLDE